MGIFWNLSKINDSVPIYVLNPQSINQIKLFTLQVHISPFGVNLKHNIPWKSFENKPYLRIHMNSHTDNMDEISGTSMGLLQNNLMFKS